MCGSCSVLWEIGLVVLRAAARYRSCDCGSTAYLSTNIEGLPRTYRHRETLIDRSSYLFHTVQLAPV